MLRYLLQAFLAASLKTDAELLKWFRDRLVWNEPETVVDLLKNGLFVRLYEPQVRIGLISGLGGNFPAIFLAGIYIGAPECRQKGCAHMQKGILTAHRPTLPFR